MRAKVTDTFDLILEWSDNGLKTITFAPFNDKEFEVFAEVQLASQMNYQGSTALSFSTMCHAYALENFRLELEALARGHTEKAEYSGSEDMRIWIGPREGRADYTGQFVKSCELIYQPFQNVGGIVIDSEIHLSLGTPEDVKGTSRAIQEVIKYLNMDLSL